MRSVFVLVVAAAVASATLAPNGIFDELVEHTPVEVLPQLVSGKAALGLCPSEAFLNYYNQVWETSLGFDGSLTWRNASSLWVQVRRMFKTGDLPTFQKLCSSRDKFYFNMGQIMYYQCINIFSLLQYSDDIQNAAIYVRMWQHLDFMCNVGFEQLLTPGTYGCIVTASGNDGCVNAYQASVNYTNPCPAVEQYMNCEKQLFNIACGTPTGYYACEDTRLGYGSYCTNLRCDIY
uniref:Secreted protein n=1 Tax=Panagrellus redivivus TaxID=6233 RepID=A0A7E4UVI1_PANRE